MTEGKKECTMLFYGKAKEGTCKVCKTRVQPLSDEVRFAGHIDRYGYVLCPWCGSEIAIKFKKRKGTFPKPIRVSNGRRGMGENNRQINRREYGGSQ